MEVRGRCEKFFREYAGITINGKRLRSAEEEAGQELFESKIPLLYPDAFLCVRTS